MMKNIYLITVLSGVLCYSTGGWAQNTKTVDFATSFLNQYASGDNELSVTTISSSMIDALKKSEQNVTLQAFLNELHTLSIITTKNAGDYCEKALSMLQKANGYEELTRTEGKQEQRLLVAKGRNKDNKATEIVMVHCNKNRLLIIAITGNISLGSLSDMPNSVFDAMRKTQ